MNLITDHLPFGSKGPNQREMIITIVNASNFFLLCFN